MTLLMLIPLIRRFSDQRPGAAPVVYPKEVCRPILGRSRLRAVYKEANMGLQAPVRVVFVKFWSGLRWQIYSGKNTG